MPFLGRLLLVCLYGEGRRDSIRGHARAVGIPDAVAHRELSGLVALLRQVAERAPDLILVGGVAAWACGNDGVTEDLAASPTDDPLY